MRSLLRLLLWIAAIGGAAAYLLHLLWFDAWVIPNDDPMLILSMMPTLGPGDTVIVQREAVPKFGQLARCPAPDLPGHYVVGRVFGEQGDQVQVVQERALVNNTRIPTRHMCNSVTVPDPVSEVPTSLSCSVEDNGAWTYSVLRGERPDRDHLIPKVEDGKLFILSDNRHFHQDSRDFGPVDASTCEHVVFRLWGESFGDASRRFDILW